MLNRHDSARRKTATIAATVNLIDNRCIKVAGAQKIRMQRVHDPIVDSQRSGTQRLTENLPAEYLWAANVLAGAAEQIDFERLQLQMFEQILQ